MSDHLYSTISSWSNTMADAGVVHAHLRCLGSIPGLNTKCRIDASQVGRSLTKCAVPLMHVKPGVHSASISWWMLEISRCLTKKASHRWHPGQVPATFSQTSGLVSWVCETLGPKSFPGRPHDEVGKIGATKLVVVMVMIPFGE